MTGVGATFGGVVIKIQLLRKWHLNWMKRCTDLCFPNDSLSAKYRSPDPILDLRNENIRGRAQGFAIFFQMIPMCTKTGHLLLGSFTFRKSHLGELLGPFQPPEPVVQGRELLGVWRPGSRGEQDCFRSDGGVQKHTRPASLWPSRVLQLISEMASFILGPTPSQFHLL